MVDDVGDVTLVVIVKHLENFEMYSCKANNQARLKSPELHHQAVLGVSNT